MTNKNTSFPKWYTNWVDDILNDEEKEIRELTES